MEKFRIPRKKKKYWKKRGLALIIPTKLRGEFASKLIKIMTKPYSAPFIDTALYKSPLKEDEQNYTWDIQK